MNRGGRKEKIHSNETWLKAWDNRRLVWRVANRVCAGTPYNPDDFLYDGLHGLAMAYENFRYGEPHNWTTYAGFCIQKYIRRGIHREMCSVHIPEDKTLPGFASIDDDTHYSAAPVAAWDDDELSDEVMASVRLVEEAIASLPDRQRQMVCLAYGIGPGGYERCDEMIAEEVGITRRAVKNSRQEGMRKIRKFIERRRACSVA